MPESRGYNGLQNRLRDRKPMEFSDMLPPSDYSAGEVFSQYSGPNRMKVKTGLFNGQEHPVPDWKARVSANKNLHEAKDILKIVLPILREERMEHKVVRDIEKLKSQTFGDISKAAVPYHQTGKFITIYRGANQSEDEFVRVLKRVDDALYKAGIASKEPDNSALTDRLIGRSGHVSYRYGAGINPTVKNDPDGSFNAKESPRRVAVPEFKVVTHDVAKDGQYYPDQRVPGLYAPLERFGDDEIATAAKRQRVRVETVSEMMGRVEAQLNNMRASAPTDRLEPIRGLRRRFLRARGALASAGIIPASEGDVAKAHAADEFDWIYTGLELNSLVDLDNTGSANRLKGQIASLFEDPLLEGEKVHKAKLERLHDIDGARDRVWRIVRETQLRKVRDAGHVTSRNLMR